MNAPQLQELAPVRGTFRPVVEAVVPEALVDNALRARPRPLRVQLRLLLRLIRWLPLLRWGRTFPSLSLDARRRFLATLQDAPILALRRGVWGIRTLAFMGFYGQEEVRRELGYAARLRGRRDREAPIPGRRRGEVLDVTPEAGG